MAPSEVVTQIVTMFGEFMTYMLPIIGILAGISFVVSWFMSVTMGLGRRTFRG